MTTDLLETLRVSLAGSDSATRKAWALEIVESGEPLKTLFSLLHGEVRTAQRFTWLLGDVAALNPELMIPCMPLLLSLCEEMPFSGMQRSVAKWLLLTNVPEQIESESITQFFRWLNSESACIASKSYSARALFEMVKQNRVPQSKVAKAVKGQIGTINPAYSYRMKKLLGV
jgi:hypothetical protein